MQQADDRLKGIDNSTWKKLTGNPEEFSMENRAFNFVCVISFFLLIICLVFDVLIYQTVMSWILVGLSVLLVVMYYFSRYKKQHKLGVSLFVLCSYAALFLNYFLNEGINGPTLSLFSVTFIFLVTLTKPRYHPIWIVVHVAVVMSLLITEYYFPETVPLTYATRAARFMDIGLSCCICITFIFATNNYLRNYYNSKKILADERALAILEQNKKIISQNQLLETVNEEKNKLFSIVSHDLKSPLDSIRGYLTLLSDNMLDDDEKQEIQEELLDQTKYTSDLLLNLMTWAKAQMHGVKVNLTPIHIAKLVDDVALHKKSVAARKGIKLTYSINNNIEVIGDRDMLHIVLRNLVNNAIKFTDAGGEVSIKASVTGEKVEISVQDTGIGISPDKQDEIFTMKTTSTYGTSQEKGIGLGLMMCKEFMQYQHGEIWFDSKPGTGSTFYISLPLTRL
jgi:two-component system, sensor histidine kinase and response regulator